MSFLTSREQVAPQGIGKPVRRREDARLLTGGGRFADDMSLPGQAYVYIVRSPHAHARIASIDTGPAEQVPGVIAVLTGGDAEGDGVQPIPHRPVPANPRSRCRRSRNCRDCDFASVNSSLRTGHNSLGRVTWHRKMLWGRRRENGNYVAA
jgi:hypothetical protein